MMARNVPQRSIAGTLGLFNRDPRADSSDPGAKAVSSESQTALDAWVDDGGSVAPLPAPAIPRKSRAANPPPDTTAGRLARAAADFLSTKSMSTRNAQLRSEVSGASWSARADQAQLTLE